MGVLLETRRTPWHRAKKTWLPLPRRAPGTSKATNLARKYRGVHTEEASNIGSATHQRDIGQPPDPV